jgi:hypothetical protein
MVAAVRSVVTCRRCLLQLGEIPLGLVPLVPAVVAAEASAWLV